MRKLLTHKSTKNEADLSQNPVAEFVFPKELEPLLERQETKRAFQSAAFCGYLVEALGIRCYNFCHALCAKQKRKGKYDENFY